MNPIDDDMTVPTYDEPTPVVTPAQRLGIRVAMRAHTLGSAPNRAAQLGIGGGANQRAARLGIGSALGARAARLGSTSPDDGDQEKSA